MCDTLCLTIHSIHFGDVFFNSVNVDKGNKIACVHSLTHIYTKCSLELHKDEAPHN
jgi:hypothetical protein